MNLSAGSHLPPASAQIALKVGQGVEQALRRQGEARVVIALLEPSSLKASRPDLSRVRSEVAALQDRVLAAVTTLDYRPRLRFQAVPALAGTVLSDAGLAKLAAHPSVARIDLDVGGSGGLAGSVPFIGANGWHAKAITGANVVVAVLDTGIDSDHDDLGDNLIQQECFLDNDGTIDGSGLCPNGSDRQSGAGAAEDGAGHGTHVSGIITSRGTRSSVGVAPDAGIVSIKVLDNSSFSGSFAFFSEIVAALDFIINNRPDVRVINMSLGTFALFDGDCDASTAFNMAGATAIDTLRSRGVIAFASSGNNGSGTQMTSPACLRNVVSVGATDNNNIVASFANSNASTDIFAPGVNVVSAAIGNGTTPASGTSMASPHAAGCAALFIQSGEAVTPDQIEARLESSPVQVADATNGLTFPRIDCSPRPPASVSISGPAIGAAGGAYTFTASTSPLTATQPLSYTWQASEQAIISRTAGLSDTLALAWPTPGAKTITVTVHNAAGVVTNTHTIAISAIPPTSVSINGPAAGSIGNPYAFTASTSPLTATQPLSYTWQASEQAIISRTAGLSDTLALAWPTPGTKTITVTVQSAGGIVTDTHTIAIAIDRRVYLPLVAK
jgi:subtilisin family serine protease